MHVIHSQLIQLPMNTLLEMVVTPCQVYQLHTSPIHSQLIQLPMSRLNVGSGGDSMSGLLITHITDSFTVDPTHDEQAGCQK